MIGKASKVFRFIFNGDLLILLFLAMERLKLRQQEFNGELARIIHLLEVKWLSLYACLITK